MQNIIKSLNINNRFIIRLFIVIVLLWISIGYYPFMSYEGDSTLICAGCERLYANGLKLPPDLFYQWNMQPLLGVIIVVIKHILPTFSCEQIYYVLTVLSSVLFLFASSIFVSKLTKIRWEYCFFAVLLFPESIAIGSYANTAIFAALISLLGMLLAINKPINIYSIILLGVAPLFRVDILLIYPVVFFIFLNKNDLKKSLYYTTLYAIFVFVISFVGFWVLKANPLITLAGFDITYLPNDEIFDNYFRIYSTFFPIVTIVLVIYGTFQLVRKKDFKILAISFIPYVILSIIYIRGMHEPKHILYIIPFLSILIIISLKELKKHLLSKKYLFSVIVIILIISQYLIGFRFFPSSKPWNSKTYSQIYSRPEIVSLKSHIKGMKGNYEIVIGAGSIIPTHDENMLISGYLFAPFYWHSIKQQEIDERKILEKIISDSSDSLYIVTLGSDWPLLMHLHSLGFKINDLNEKNSNFDYCLVRGNQKIFEKCCSVERTPESFNNAFNSIGKKPVYVMSIWDWQRYLINENKTQAQPISNSYSLVK